MKWKRGEGVARGVAAKLLDIDAEMVDRLRLAAEDRFHGAFQSLAWGQRYRDGFVREYRVADGVPWRTDGCAMVRKPAAGVPSIRAKVNAVPVDESAIGKIVAAAEDSTAKPVATSRLGPVLVVDHFFETLLVVAVPGMKRSMKHRTRVNAVRLAALVRWTKADAVKAFVDGKGLPGVALLRGGAVVAVLMGVKCPRSDDRYRSLDDVLAENADD